MSHIQQNKYASFYNNVVILKLNMGGFYNQVLTCCVNNTLFQNITMKNKKFVFDR